MDHLTYHVGTKFGEAKNHTICQGPYMLAHVIPMGYPIGKGWSPQSEALARQIVDALNEQNANTLGSSK